MTLRALLNGNTVSNESLQQLQQFLQDLDAELKDNDNSLPIVSPNLEQKRKWTEGFFRSVGSSLETYKSVHFIDTVKEVITKIIDSI